MRDIRVQRDNSDPRNTPLRKNESVATSAADNSNPPEEGEWPELEVPLAPPVPSAPPIRPEEKKKNVRQSVPHKPFRKDMPITAIFVLEDFFSHKLRHTFLKFLTIILVIVILVIGASVYIPLFPGASTFLNPYLSPQILQSIFTHASGLFFVLFSLWCSVYVLETFHRSLYYHNREAKYAIEGERTRPVAEIVELFYDTDDGDVLRTFLLSRLGEMTLFRLGIGRMDLNDFLDTREDRRTLTFHEIETHQIYTRTKLGEYIFSKYDEFSQFLFARGITEKMFLGSLSWMVEIDTIQKFAERWWSADKLAKIPGFGGEWSYGRAYTLERYSVKISPNPGAGNTSDYINRRAKYVSQLEAILSKSGEANALLVGENGVGREKILSDLARRMLRGNTTPEIAGRQLVLLNTDLLISGLETKNEFEFEFMRILEDAISAGNIVLVFDNFAGFMRSAQAAGSEPLTILNKYLASPDLQVVALANTSNYHQTLETNSVMNDRFEVITIEEPGYEQIIGILEDTALPLERQYGVVFTYPALLEVARSAKYYITEGVMPDKALDLLALIGPRMRAQSEPFVTRQVVQELVSEKTNIPLGDIGEKEASKLEDLESSLHGLVIGQNAAISSLSNSLRRSRAGLRDLEKPVSSFLFLGPTGVGKTQTAKAVAEVYYGDREAMSRIDMSEYQTPDALGRLIGSFETGKVGTLTTLVKSRPYGVLLLDELEKANRDVHDLFLQILDEGFFSDMEGKQVNARNLIFIATSNAGSERIWQASEEGRDISEMKDDLVNFIISEGLYRPEFLNRFDDIVLFHPLSREDIRQVAELMLRATQKRIKDQGYDLVITDALLDFTVEQGYDPAFGARPMERAIQDTVEQVIAKRIISGGIQKGATVELSAADLLGA